MTFCCAFEKNDIVRGSESLFIVSIQRNIDVHVIITIHSSFVIIEILKWGENPSGRILNTESTVYFTW